MVSRNGASVLLAVIFLASSGCKLFKKKEAPDASAPARGKPFVLSSPHDVKAAVWLPNGDLLGASEKELYVVTPGAPAARRIENRADIYGLHGKNSAPTFFVHDDKGLVLWDATTLSPKKSFDGPNRRVLAEDDSRAVIYEVRDAVSTLQVVDLASGEVVGSLESSMQQMPNVDLSPGARYARILGSDLVIADVKTGKTLIRRSPPADRGELLFEVRGDRLILESDRGLEMFALPSDKVIAQMAPPFPADSLVRYGVSADGKQLAAYSNQELLVWAPDSPTPLRRLPGVAEEAACAGVEGAPKVCPPHAAASEHFALTSSGFKIRTAGDHECAIVERTTRKVFVEATAPCEPPHEASSKAEFRKDESYFGAAYRGGLFAIELRSAAFSGLGDPTSFPLYDNRSIVMENGLLRIVGDTSQWLTSKPPKALPLPPGAKDKALTRTPAYRFKLERPVPTAAVLHVWDKAAKEVMSESVPDPVRSMEVTDNVAYLQRPDGNYFRCEVGKSCVPVDYGGEIRSADGTWVVLGQRSQDRDGAHLFDTLTKASRPIPAACAHQNAIGVVVLRDGPQVLCANREDEKLLVDASGKVIPIPAPAKLVVHTGFIGREGNFVYFAPSAILNNAEPAFRFDLKTHEMVSLYLSPDGAVGVFPDGKIDHVGSEASLGVLRCLDGDQLLPWSACKAAFEVSGRF